MVVCYSCCFVCFFSYSFLAKEYNSHFKVKSEAVNYCSVLLLGKYVLVLRTQCWENFPGIGVSRKTSWRKWHLSCNLIDEHVLLIRAGKQGQVKWLQAEQTVCTKCTLYLAYVSSFNFLPCPTIPPTHTVCMCTLPNFSIQQICINYLRLLPSILCKVVLFHAIISCFLSRVQLQALLRKPILAFWNHRKGVLGKCLNRIQQALTITFFPLCSLGMKNTQWDKGSLYQNPLAVATELETHQERLLSLLANFHRLVGSSPWYKCLSTGNPQSPERPFLMSWFFQVRCHFCLGCC